MDVKISAGLLLSSVLVVAVVIVLLFNPLNFDTSPVSNGLGGTVNQTDNNNTDNDVILPSHLSTVNALFIPSSQEALVTTSTTLPFTPSYLDTMLAKFDIYVQKFFSENLIPASVIVIVKDAIIYQKCLGVKEYGAQDVVNEDKLFHIGSCSKAFNSANIAQLVDLGIMHGMTL